MPFVQSLDSTEPRIIKAALFSILNEITSLEVLELDQAFKKTKDKHAFLAQFEALGDEAPKSHPALLEKWSHYCWIRLELTYLANQKASLNHIMMMKEESTTPINRTLESVSRAIQEDAASGVPIEQSIKVLQQMTLQIVGTEHPTDPLSQEARDTLTKIANAIDEAQPDSDTIKHLLSNLLTIDAIPHTRRSVVEEVNRNIDITLEKLYDNLPHLVQNIVDAYTMHYGEDVYLLHEQDILRAIEGGEDIDGTLMPALLRDASWPGFDADGNDNVTPAVMRDSIRIYRIRVSEKHIKTLDSSIAEGAKKIERKLRKMLFSLNEELTTEILHITSSEALPIIAKIWKDQNNASTLLDERRYAELIPIYEGSCDFLHSFAMDSAVQDRVRGLLSRQLETTQTLTQLAQFSGFYRLGGVAHEGDLQKFRRIFTEYKDAIRDDTDAITIKNAQGELIPAAKLVLDEYHRLVQAHDIALKNHPELYKELRYFGMQLHCFGMTYGVGHIRQDSPIFTKVWNALLTDLALHPAFSEYSLLLPLKTKSYNDLSHTERFELHKHLQNGSDESNSILDAIFHKHNNSDYSSKPNYKNNPDFAWVRSELERLELAILHKDMFENIIISNCETPVHILEVESLLAVFNKETYRSTLTIVPLLEKRQDLENHEAILLDYIKTKIQREFEHAFDKEAGDPEQPLKNMLGIHAKDDIKRFVESKSRTEFDDFLKKTPMLRAYLNKISMEIMVGFSDTERVSGMSALIAVKKVQEDFIRLSHDFGVNPKIYYGPGGDPNRGGLKRRDQKSTLQGNARSNVLNTDKSARWFRENQFYQAYKLISDPSRRFEITSMPKDRQEWLDTCMREGASLYEQLHDTQKGLGQLLGFMLGQGAHWMVTILNSSSRASDRGTAKQVGDRTAAVQTNGTRPAAFIDIDTQRAITAAQMKEVLRDQLDFIGPCYGLRQIGKEQMHWLYDQSETFRDLVEKECMGVALRDLSFIKHSLFADHPELLPQTEAQKYAWAIECLTTYPARLRSMNIKKMSADPLQKDALLIMLSRLLAYISVECELTQQFLFSLHKILFNVMDNHMKPMKYAATNPVELLSRYPVWQEETMDIISEVEPLSYMLARQSHHVARGRNLDVIYPGLNEQSEPRSRLTGIGRLIANIGAGITAARIMQPGFYEQSFVDYSQAIVRPGVVRATREAKEIGREVQIPHLHNKGVLRFFDPSQLKTLEDGPKSAASVTPRT